MSLQAHRRQPEERRRGEETSIRCFLSESRLDGVESSGLVVKREPVEEEGQLDRGRAQGLSSSCERL